MFIVHDRKSVGTRDTKKTQREKYHIKDLYCLKCCMETKNIELRYCDSYDEVYNKALKIRSKYYG